MKTNAKPIPPAMDCMIYAEIFGVWMKSDLHSLEFYRVVLRG